MYSVAVRALCEFTAKQGDLDLRFTPSPSALEGIAGHQIVAARRPTHYQREVKLAGEYKKLLQVSGRADGYDPNRQRLEEIKTYRGDLMLMPANHRYLHWAQAKIYGALMCRQLDLSHIEIALVYFDVDTEKETPFIEQFTAPELRHFFEQQCAIFLGWAAQEITHRLDRDQALTALQFPHAAFRAGQRQFAEAIYKAVSTQRCLMAQAPTGIGKTVGSLFPLLKTVPAQQIDKIFYLTAKTPGRRLALDAIELLNGNAQALPLRVLELTARDKACEHPDKACHGDSCPLAKGFYDRLPAARQAAADRKTLDRQALQTIALDHQLCPYYLAQEMARWSDIVIGDYNYYLDLQAMLYTLTLKNQWRVGVLIDEAHNLIERGRKMYTAELRQRDFLVLRRSAPQSLKKALDRLHRQWRALTNEQALNYRALEDIPAKLLAALQNVAATIGEYFNRHPTTTDNALQNFYFDALLFCRIAETFGEHSLFDITLDSANTQRQRNLSILCLRNIVPAPFLKPRFMSTHSTILFSATLTPQHFYRDLLGLPAATPWIDVQSPFTADQLSVQIVDKISTRFADRKTSLAPIVDLMAWQFKRRPGNYLAFFSSFEYLQQVAALFRQRHADIDISAQSQRMGETARNVFLEQFTPASRCIGFVVLGGAFGEGIDLPGARLIGAFIATLGLPQLNVVNEQIKQRMEAMFGAGYDYTYFYPGLQKVIQAAGRVIRTAQDRGALFLIDDRFDSPQVRQLLPRWWSINSGVAIP
jgi:DNA excision repair protein ERCC-2